MRAWMDWWVHEWMDRRRRGQTWFCQVGSSWLQIKDQWDDLG